MTGRPVGGAGKRWADGSASDYARGIYSPPYWNDRERSIGTVEAMHRSGLFDVPALVSAARRLHRSAWENEQRRTRADG